MGLKKKVSEKREKGFQGRLKRTERGRMTDRNRELVPESRSLVIKRKSAADHWTLSLPWESHCSKTFCCCYCCCCGNVTIMRLLLLLQWERRKANLTGRSTLRASQLTPASATTSLRLIVNVNQPGYVVQRRKSAGVKVFVCLTPSLPQPVKFPCWKVLAQACKQYIFRS